MMLGTYSLLVIWRHIYGRSKTFKSREDSAMITIQSPEPSTTITVSNPVDITGTSDEVLDKGNILDTDSMHMFAINGRSNPVSIKMDCSKCDCCNHCSCMCLTDENRNNPITIKMDCSKRDCCNHCSCMCLSDENGNVIQYINEDNSNMPLSDSMCSKLFTAGVDKQTTFDSNLEIDLLILDSTFDDYMVSKLDKGQLQFTSQDTSSTLPIAIAVDSTEEYDVKDITNLSLFKSLCIKNKCNIKDLYTFTFLSDENTSSESHSSNKELCHTVISQRCICEPINSTETMETSSEVAKRITNILNHQTQTFNDIYSFTYISNCSSTDVNSLYPDTVHHSVMSQMCICCEPKPLSTSSPGVQRIKAILNHETMDHKDIYNLSFLSDDYYD